MLNDDSQDLSNHFLNPSRLGSMRSAIDVNDDDVGVVKGNRLLYCFEIHDKSAGAEGKIVIGFTLLQDADAAGVSCYFSMFGCQEILVKIIKTET